MMCMCVYKIFNKINNHCYIGSTVKSKSRWRGHAKDLNNKRHHSPYLQRAWNKYGENNFKFEIIEEILDKSRLIEREQYYFDVLKPEYNMCRPGADPKKLSEAHKNQKPWNKGKKNVYNHTIETKKKMSESHNGLHNKWTKQGKLNNSIAQTGKMLSKETRQRMSEAKKGIRFSKKHVENIRKAAIKAHKRRKENKTLET